MRCGLAILVLCVLAAPAWAAGSDDAVFAALDAVGPLDGNRADPRTVIRAVNALQPLGKDKGVALLRRYFAERRSSQNSQERDGLFLVLRTLLVPEPASGPRVRDACTPEQQAVAAGGCLRPPRLGAPVPPPPHELLSLRYPAFVLGDVPLSLVSGYVLGGEAESLDMYLDAIAPVAGWLPKPLQPKTAGEVRYLFVHYGQWSLAGDVGKLVEAQLARLEAPEPAAACLDLGLWCLPRAAPSSDALVRTFRATHRPPSLRLEHGDKRLFLLFLEWPTDSVLRSTVAGWSWSQHFGEWRLFLLQEVTGAQNLHARIDPNRGILEIRGKGATAVSMISLNSIPESAR